MYNNEFFHSPHYIPKNTYPFLDKEIESSHRFQHHNEFEDFDEFDEEDFYENNRSSDMETNIILELLYNNEPDLFSNFKKFRISTGMVKNFFSEIIPYALDNSSKYRGDIEQKSHMIYTHFKRQNYPVVFSVLSAGVPEDIMDNTFKDVIKTCLGSRFVPPTVIDR